MRRASTRLALLGLALLALGLPATALAAPSVTFKAKAIPIKKNPSSKGGPTWPGTGNIKGAATAVEAEFTIKGSEYFGGPSPLVGVTVTFPTGAKVTTKGFTTCSTPILESHEVQNCPKKSVAGPQGEAAGVVSFGGTRVHEKLTVQPFFAAGGGLAFYAEGRSPALIELLSKGAFTSLAPTPTLFTEVPLVISVPEAPYGSAEYIKVVVGAAFMKGKKLVSYGTLPKTCKGSFKETATLKFYSGESVNATASQPCPKK
ncbi:MAG: hypothetical protein ACRDK4_04370 [Solirubrobacteraceae bacterium]